jgi:hypothetical protein
MILDPELETSEGFLLWLAGLRIEPSGVEFGLLTVTVMAGEELFVSNSGFCIDCKKEEQKRKVEEKGK